VRQLSKLATALQGAQWLAAHGAQHVSVSMGKIVKQEIKHRDVDVGRC